MVNSDIALILSDAIKHADCWGLGRISTAKQDIEDAGYKWTDEMEDFVFRFDYKND